LSFEHDISPRRSTTPPADPRRLRLRSAKSKSNIPSGARLHLAYLRRVPF
jgi:hypothetical protein